MGHTMREVAKRAGVSPATVSRVLNKTQYISTEMEQRVLEVVRQLNYYKNVHARRLATGQSDLFGLVISEIANPFFPEIIHGFQAAAWDRGLDVLLCNTEYNQARTKSVIRKLIESDVRGVAIMTSSVDRSVTSDLIAAGVGVVFCNLGPAEKLVSNISIDYQRGISQAIEHVVALGHRRAARAREAQRLEGAEVEVDALRDRVAVGRLRKERAQPRAARGALLLHDAEGAELPDEVGEAFGRVGGDGDREFPVTGTHDQPRSFFILSMNALASGPRCSVDADSKASRASRCLALSFCGTSSSRR